MATDDDDDDDDDDDGYDNDDDGDDGDDDGDDGDDDVMSVRLGRAECYHLTRGVMSVSRPRHWLRSIRGFN